MPTLGGTGVEALVVPSREHFGEHATSRPQVYFNPVETITEEELWCPVEPRRDVSHAAARQGIRICRTNHHAGLRLESPIVLLELLGAAEIADL